jgi:hypothetical protein
MAGGRTTGGGGAVAADREELRRTFAVAVTRMLVSSELRSVLCRPVDGSPSPIVVALPDDRMGDVFLRLASYRGCATLVCPTDSGFSIASSTPAEIEWDDVDDACAIHDDSPVDMFMDYLRQVRRPVRCHRAEPACDVELIDDGINEVLVS